MESAIAAPTFKRVKPVNTRMTKTLRSTPSRALRVPAGIPDGETSHVVRCQRGARCRSGTRNLGHSGSSADEQSGGVSPTDRLCTFLTPCESWPVPPLLNLDQGSYVPAPEQKASLRALEAQAVANVIKGHGLTDADTDAVKTWGRYDALAALYTLIVEAINETDRTTDQQNVADWVANAGKQLSIGAAQAAGREYVKWAGLDRSTFESLLKSDTSEADLKAFLQGVPLNYNNPNTTLATGGLVCVPIARPVQHGLYGVEDRSVVPGSSLYRIFSGANLRRRPTTTSSSGARAPPAPRS